LSPGDHPGRRVGKQAGGQHHAELGAGHPELTLRQPHAPRWTAQGHPAQQADRLSRVTLGVARSLSRRMPSCPGARGLRYVCFLRWRTERTAASAIARPVTQCRGLQACGRLRSENRSMRSRPADPSSPGSGLNTTRLVIPYAGFSLRKTSGSSGSSGCRRIPRRMAGIGVSGVIVRWPWRTVTSAPVGRHPLVVIEQAPGMSQRQRQPGHPLCRREHHDDRVLPPLRLGLSVPVPAPQVHDLLPVPVHRAGRPTSPRSAKLRRKASATGPYPSSASPRMSARGTSTLSVMALASLRRASPRHARLRSARPSMLEPRHPSRLGPIGPDRPAGRGGHRRLRCSDVITTSGSPACPWPM
jgi:hypothetical protein